MNKKKYIIPQTSSEHIIMAGVIAGIPVYGGDNVSPTESGGLTKERDTYNYKYEDEAWGTISHSIW